MTVRVVTDNARDLPRAVADAHRIDTDRRDLTNAEFWTRSRASTLLPTTAAPAPGQYEATVRGLTAEGAESIVCLSLSGELPAIVQSARLAADAVVDVIRVEVGEIGPVIGTHSGRGAIGVAFHVPR